MKTQAQRARTKRLAWKYCEDNGLHKGGIVQVTCKLPRNLLRKDGINSWANYQTDRTYRIVWKKETPLEKCESIETKEHGTYIDVDTRVKI